LILGRRTFATFLPVRKCDFQRFRPVDKLGDSRHEGWSWPVSAMLRHPRSDL